MNNFLPKKLFFTFIIVLLNFLLLEVICLLILKAIEPRYLNKFILESNSKKIKKTFIKTINSKKIPYLRDMNQYDGKIYINLEKKRDFIFNEINSFSKDNKFNILVQGDSYGESLNFKNINYFYKDFFKKKKIGLINSSTSSYAMTANYFQLSALINDFKLNPEILITYYDQTDIGDDLYRYSIFFDDEKFKEYKNYDEKLMNSFVKSNLNSIKIFFIMKNYFYREKARYKTSNYETVKKIFRRIYLKNIKKMPIQLEPLYYGIKSHEKKKLIDVINNYITLSFTNKNLQKIYFVVHPHNNHLNNLYIMDNREILYSAIKNHKFRDKIEVISFFDNDQSFYDFIENDIFSHSKNKYYIGKFWPKIFSRVLLEK